MEKEKINSVYNYALTHKTFIQELLDNPQQALAKPELALDTDDINYLINILDSDMSIKAKNLLEMVSNISENKVEMLLPPPWDFPPDPWRISTPRDEQT